MLVPDPFEGALLPKLRCINSLLGPLLNHRQRCCCCCTMWYHLGITHQQENILTISTLRCESSKHILERAVFLGLKLNQESAGGPLGPTILIFAVAPELEKRGISKHSKREVRGSVSICKLVPFFSCPGSSIPTLGCRRRRLADFRIRTQIVTFET